MNRKQFLQTIGSGSIGSFLMPLFGKSNEVRGHQDPPGTSGHEGEDGFELQYAIFLRYGDCQLLTTGNEEEVLQEVKQYIEGMRKVDFGTLADGYRVGNCSFAVFDTQFGQIDLEESRHNFNQIRLATWWLDGESKDDLIYKLKHNCYVVLQKAKGDKLGDDNWHEKLANLKTTDHWFYKIG